MCGLPTICGLTACSRFRKGHCSSLLSWKYPCREAIYLKNRCFCATRLRHSNRVPACPALWHGASYTDLWFGKSCPTFLELGVGMMTPMFIKEPFMNMVYQWPHATYVPINPQHAIIPKEIAGKSLAVNEDIAFALKTLLGKPTITLNLPHELYIPEEIAGKSIALPGDIAITLNRLELWLSPPMKYPDCPPP